MDTGRRRRYAVTHRRNLHPQRDQLKMQYSTTQNVTPKGTGKKQNVQLSTDTRGRNPTQ